MPKDEHPTDADPTMRDVAHAAGVSKALVSIVFRGVAGASDETRARVFAAAERIGYRANRTASLLARAPDPAPRGDDAPRATRSTPSWSRPSRRRPTRSATRSCSASSPTEHDEASAPWRRSWSSGARR